MDRKLPRGHFLPKMIHKNKFQLKIPILSKNDGGATYVHTCHQNSSTWACSKYVQRSKNHFAFTWQYFWGLVIFSWEQWVFYFVILKKSHSKLDSGIILEVCHTRLTEKASHSVKWAWLLLRSCHSHFHFIFNYYVSRLLKEVNKVWVRKKGPHSRIGR